MKKILFSIMTCLMLCTGCGEKATLEVPDVIEPTIEEIKKSNLEAAQNTFINIKKAAELYYLELQIDSNYVPSDIKIDFSDNFTIPENFVFSGIMPTSGIVSIDKDGNVLLSNININGIICNYNEENMVICK